MRIAPTDAAATEHNDAENPLLDLPPAALGTLRGERRGQLVAYLLRWQHGAVLRGYLDEWLAAQPDAATLRQQRAQALVLTGEPDAALDILDVLDSERGPTQSRAAIRWDALAALERYDDLFALAPAPEDASPATLYDWLRHGDALRLAGRLDEAADAYAIATESSQFPVPSSESEPSTETDASRQSAPGTAPLRRLAELALAAGDAAAARGHLETLFVRNPDRRPAVDDLRLLRRAVVALADDAAARALDAQLAAREREERAAVLAVLGVESAAFPVPSSQSEVAEATSSPVERGTRNAERGTSHAELPAEAYTTLRDDFGLADFRPNQAATIAYALAGQPALAVMPTGAGKSLTYQLPALLLPHATLVVSPLIALMQDQLAGLPPALRDHATAINSSLTGSEMRERLRGVAAGAYKLVYVAPERLRNRPFLHALRRAGISLFVVDEAHCVSMWGLSFRPDYLFLTEAIRALGAPPVLALTATAGTETQAEIADRLGTRERVQASVFRPNLRFEVQHAGNKEEKRRAVLRLCTEVAGPVIVYARSRDACEELAAMLRRQGVSAAHYHAQTPDRAAVQERFMAGETRVLVATVAFGMGVDKADVRAIIHFNLPQSVEAYYQEAGRAGRDGQPARCILLYSGSDKSQMVRWLHEGAITKDHLRHLYRTLRGMAGKKPSAVSHQPSAGGESSSLTADRRPLAASSFGIVSLDDVGRAAARVNNDETFSRVGVSMLERVGLVRRHFDVPRQVTVTLHSGVESSECRVPSSGRLLAPIADDSPLSPNLALGTRHSELSFDAFVAATGLYLDETGDYDLLTLAEAVGVAPDALEAALLEWQTAGLVRYTGGGRDALIELLPAPTDVGERIDALLADYAARQEARIEAMAAYARGTTCRHAMLAAHFGQHLGRCGTACDLCLSRGARSRQPPAVSRQQLADGASGGAGFGLPPTPSRLKPAPPKTLAPAAPDNDPRPDALRVLAGVASLPYPLGRSGLARTLRGAADAPVKEARCAEYGNLRGSTGKAVEELIERLVTDGLLTRDTSDYRLLSLSSTGRAALADPASLPEWAQPGEVDAAEPDPDVVAALKAWRTEQARAKDLPPHYILSQATLEALAALRPRTEAALLRVRGIGPKIVAQYGDDLLALLA